MRLAHPLYGEVARAGLSVSRRRRWHAELAAAVHGHGSRRREDALQTATWSLDSDEPPSTEALLVASTQAQWRFDLPLAERFARAALAAGGGVKVQVALSEAVFRQGRGEEALDILAQAATEVTTPEEIAEVADAQAHVLNLVGRPVEASEVLAAASASVPPAIAERLDARAAVLSLFAGRVEEALDAVDRLVAAYSGDWDQLPELLRVRCDYVASLALAPGRPLRRGGTRGDRELRLPHGGRAPTHARRAGADRSRRRLPHERPARGSPPPTLSSSSRH